jgi:hypothetical protein
LIVCGKVELVAAPLLSCAGVKRARLERIRQVAESSVRDPLDDATEQPVTRPLEPTLSTTLTVPCSSFWIEDYG